MVIWEAHPRWVKNVRSMLVDNDEDAWDDDINTMQCGVDTLLLLQS